jgi:hypothetical protein
MSRVNRPALSGWLFLSLLGGATGARADVIYQNTDYSTVKDYVFSHEYGDEITFAGTLRDINRITFQYYANVLNSVGATATIQFYAKDGILADPTKPSTQMPKSLLWQSPAFPLINGLVNNSIDLTSPVLMPDTVVWTIRVNGINYGANDGVGLVLADPPTIGGLLPGVFHPVVGSYNDFWIKQNDARDDSWALENFGFGPGDPQANFYMVVEAIPEPGVVALGIVGTAAALALARKRRR